MTTLQKLLKNVSTTEFIQDVINRLITAITANLIVRLLLTWLAQLLN